MIILYQITGEIIMSYLFKGSSVDASGPLKSKAKAGPPSLAGTIGVDGITIGVVRPDEVEYAEPTDALQKLDVVALEDVTYDEEFGKLIRFSLCFDFDAVS